ncbi:MAG: hypothetical protein WBK64_02310 [Dethiobacteria bacterium]|nr:hypothetical protein [Bacillota bacterium]HOL15550.1 hypothetical protein [Bacillota bacterium]
MISWGDGKATAVFLWAALLLLISGMVIYLLFFTPPEQPRRSLPVLAKLEQISTRT